MCKSTEEEFVVVYIVYKHFNSAHCAIIANVCVRFQYIPTSVLLIICGCLLLFTNLSFKCEIVLGRN